MLIIGERINCTRKRVAEAAEKRDAEHMANEARRQMEAGAGVIDVNGGIGGQEEELLPWLVEVVQDAMEVQLCLDSPSHQALANALPLCKQRPIVNSVTAEPGRMEQILPLIKEHNAQIVALCFSESQTAVQGSAERIEIASRLIGQLTDGGVAIEDIFVDPGVFPLSTGSNEGLAALETIKEVRSQFPGVRTTVGLSNISFGLPQRRLINQVFIITALAMGLDSAIADPLDSRLMACVTAAEAILGMDDYSANYIKAFREGKLTP